MDSDRTERLRDRSLAAAAAGTPLAVTGGGTKEFLGRITQAEHFDVAGHRGIVSYEPTELVLSARGGTPLAEVTAALDERGQMLAFEPPSFGAQATIGGTIATGLSGPARPYAGAARDFVLGTRVLNGKGEVLRFGGEVMKNVAGYDVSRLMTGACGTLGVLLDVSLKVLPLPAVSRTLAFDVAAAEAIERCNAWAATPVPVTGACHDGERLRIRLSGTAGGVEAAARALGGETLDGDAFWTALREQTLPCFTGAGEVWRVSVPPGAEPIRIGGDVLVDWGGALRWLRTDAPADEVRAAAERAGGHATLFRGGDRTREVFHPLPPAVRRLHERLKAAFDPRGIFNPGRMYEGI